MEKKPLILIPAHLDSKRFPGKLLKEWKGKPLLQHTYERCLETGFETHVISSDEIICDNPNFDPWSSPFAENGTDRCSKLVEESQPGFIQRCWSIIINVQADEVEINPEHIIQLAAFAEKKGLPVSTLCSKWQDKRQYKEGDVEVFNGLDQKALFFNRISSWGDPNKHSFKHLGVYAYSLFFLEQYTKLKKGPLEEATNLEQFRVLENGMQIGCLEVDSPNSVAVNTEDDYNFLLQRGD